MIEAPDGDDFLEQKIGHHSRHVPHVVNRACLRAVGDKVAAIEAVAEIVPLDF